MPRGGFNLAPPRSLKEMLKQTPAFLPSPLLYQELSVVTLTVDAGIFLYQKRSRRRAIMKVSLIRRATFNVIVSRMPNWLKLNRHHNLTRYLSLVKDSCYKYTYVTLWYYYDVSIFQDTSILRDTDLNLTAPSRKQIALDLAQNYLFQENLPQL